MPDKMMRVAGRDENGNAKALITDTNGSLHVKHLEQEQLQREMLQNQKLFMGMKAMVYGSGSEYVPFDEPIVRGEGQNEGIKESSWLRLTANLFKGVSFTTSEPVDLSNVTKIKIDWEFEKGDGVTTPYPAFLLVTNKPTDVNPTNKVAEVKLPSQNFPRGISELDVSAVTSKVFFVVQVHIDGNRTIPSTLKVHNIWLEREGA